MSAYLSTALKLRGAIDPLIALASGKSKEFPYEQVRAAVATLIGESSDKLPRYGVMIEQQKEALAWLRLLGAMEARMLHAHRQEDK